MSKAQVIKVVVVGASAGGLYALKKLLPALPASFSCSMLIVQHMSPHSDSYMARMLNELSVVTVKEADEKELIRPGTVYIAPPDYHLLVEADYTLSLSVEEKVNYSRPSIDVLFETAADVYGIHLMGIILTGANDDGSNGLYAVKKNGGFIIVQDPNDAESPAMPRAAIERVKPHKILTLKQISALLSKEKICI